MITGVMEDVSKKRPKVRQLVVVLGDQLDRTSAAFDDFDRTKDVVWMCEARDESVRIPVSLPRIAMFLSAMRHFRVTLESERIRVIYRELTEKCASIS